MTEEVFLLSLVNTLFYSHHLGNALQLFLPPSLVAEMSN